MSAPNIVVSGFVVKRGQSVKSWKTRWLSLTNDGKLRYYKVKQEPKTPKDLPKPAGEVDIRNGCLAVLPRKQCVECEWPAESAEDTGFGIKTAARTFYMFAPQAHDCANWIIHLRSMSLRCARNNSTSSAQLLDVRIPSFARDSVVRPNQSAAAAAAASSSSSGGGGEKSGATSEHPSAPSSSGSTCPAHLDDDGVEPGPEVMELYSQVNKPRQPASIHRNGAGAAGAAHSYNEYENMDDFPIQKLVDQMDYADLDFSDSKGHSSKPQQSAGAVQDTMYATIEPADVRMHSPSKGKQPNAYGYVPPHSSGAGQAVYENFEPAVYENFDPTELRCELGQQQQPQGGAQNTKRRYENVELQPAAGGTRKQWSLRRDASMEQ